MTRTFDGCKTVQDIVRALVTTYHALNYTSCPLRPRRACAGLRGQQKKHAWQDSPCAQACRLISVYSCTEVCNLNRCSTFAACLLTLPRARIQIELRHLLASRSSPRTRQIRAARLHWKTPPLPSLCKSRRDGVSEARSTAHDLCARFAHVPVPAAGDRYSCSRTGPVSARTSASRRVRASAARAACRRSTPCIGPLTVTFSFPALFSCSSLSRFRPLCEVQAMITRAHL